MLFGVILWFKYKKQIFKNWRLKSCLGAVLEDVKVWSSSLKRLTKNHSFVDFAFYIGFPDLVWLTSSAENINLARKRELGPE